MLTGLYNRRYYAEELCRLDTQRNYPISLIMADINGLKLTNDTFGHTAGEAFSREKAAEEIKRFAGYQFDPEIAKVFVEKVLGEKW